MILRKTVLSLALATALALPAPSYAGAAPKDNNIAVFLLLVAVVATAVIASNGGVGFFAGKDPKVGTNPYSGHVTGPVVMDF